MNYCFRDYEHNHRPLFSNRKHLMVIKKVHIIPFLSISLSFKVTSSTHIEESVLRTSINFIELLTFLYEFIPSLSQWACAMRKPREMKNWCKEISLITSIFHFAGFPHCACSLRKYGWHSYHILSDTLFHTSEIKICNCFGKHSFHITFENLCLYTALFSNKISHIPHTIKTSVQTSFCHLLVPLEAQACVMPELTILIFYSPLKRD